MPFRPPDVPGIRKPPAGMRVAKYEFTDWELSNPVIKPENRSVGHAIVLGATLNCLSTNKPFPQSVRIQVMGSPELACSHTVHYAGPVGSPLSFWIERDWRLTAGRYKVVFIADSPEPYEYNDPNRNNNRIDFLLTVT